MTTIRTLREQKQRAYDRVPEYRVLKIRNRRFIRGGITHGAGQRELLYAYSKAGGKKPALFGRTPIHCSIAGASQPRRSSVEFHPIDVHAIKVAYKTLTQRGLDWKAIQERLADIIEYRLCLEKNREEARKETELLNR